MFYFEEINGKKVLKSDLLPEINHCFTTRGVNPSDILSNKNVVLRTPTQTHTDNVEFVDDRTEYPDTDGLIITQKNIAVYLKFADCTPLIFYDPIKNIGAVSHAGWRGTAQKIGVKTIEKMKSNPKDVIALIGPAIGVCCYEVSDDVKNKLLYTVSDSEGLTRGQKVDLKQINKCQLEEIGVSKIDVCPYCTSCDNDLFYSYRKENGTKNRHYAVLML